MGTVEKDLFEKEAPFRGNYLFIGSSDILSGITPPCNIRISPYRDPFLGIKSIDKRRMWLFLYDVGKGSNAGKGGFFLLSNLAEKLELTESKAGSCLRNLRKDGIVDYVYFCGKGYCLKYVRPIDFKNLYMSWGCPFGFRSEWLDCENCLFLGNCHFQTIKMEERT